MKIRYLVVLSLLCVFITGKSLPRMYVKVLKPAAISVDQHIKTIVIIDRTLAKSSAANILEGALTGEGIGTDTEGAQKALDGLTDIMNQSSRFEPRRTTIKLKSTTTGATFPPALGWNEISKICNANSADALLAIEIFDSDFIVTKGNKQVKKKDSEGREITVTEYYAEGVATIKIGFRLYDPSDKTLEDEKFFSSSKKWEAAGSSVADAALQLINRKNAVLNVSYNAGASYGRRITPSWTTVTRYYYKKAKKNMDVRTGARKAQVNDWEGAIAAWEKAVNSREIKVAGRAAYNLALAYEVLGDLATAKEWAERSYGDFKNKKGRDYAGVIDRRIWEENKLKEQLGE